MNNSFDILDKACALLSSGDVIGLPTETVYGLAADASQDNAVSKIYSIKGRPRFNPLIFHVSSIEMAQNYTIFSEPALDLVKHFWIDYPGPLTVVLPLLKTANISLLACAGLDTIAVRLPHHKLAVELIRRFGSALVAPSANKSNHISPTQAKDVLKEFEHEIFVLDGGPCRIGLESTIIDMTSDQPMLLRPGSVLIEDMEMILNQTISVAHGAKILAPGMLKRHYAPRKPLRINAQHTYDDETLLGFGPSILSPFNLSQSGSLIEAATNLFKYLRYLDEEPSCKKIAVSPIPVHGIGIAINDKLVKAAFNED